MKKIVSPLVLAALLIWTWHVVHTPSAIGFETHSGVQLKLAELIGKTLQKKKPDADNLRIVKIWTSPMSENKIKAIFSYSFTEKAEKDGGAEKIIEGEAVLHREPSEDPTLDKWVLQSVHTELESLNFMDGSVVLPEGDLPAETDTSSASPEGADQAPVHNTTPSTEDYK